MNPEQMLVTIAEFENTFDAELAKLTLDNAGINSLLLGDYLVTNMVYGVPSITIELQVRQNDADRAKQVLAEKDQSLDEQ